MSAKSTDRKTILNTKTIVTVLAIVGPILLFGYNYWDSTRQENITGLEAKDKEEAEMTQSIISSLKNNAPDCASLLEPYVSYISIQIKASLPPRHQKMKSESNLRKPNIDRRKKYSRGRGEIFRYVVRTYPDCYGRFFQKENPFFSMVFEENMISQLKGWVKHSFKGDNYKDSYFYNCNLYLSDFENCQFINCNLTSTYFISTDFTNVSFQASTFGSVKFINCTFNNVQFEDIQFVEGHPKAEFINCKFDQKNQLPENIISKCR